MSSFIHQHTKKSWLPKRGCSKGPKSLEFPRVVRVPNLSKFAIFGFFSYPIAVRLHRTWQWRHISLLAFRITTTRVFFNSPFKLILKETTKLRFTGSSWVDSTDGRWIRLTKEPVIRKSFLFHIGMGYFDAITDTDVLYAHSVTIFKYNLSLVYRLSLQPHSKHAHKLCIIVHL